MATLELSDPRWDTKSIRAWLQRNGFAYAEPTADGAARFVRYLGDPRAGLPAEAVEVRLSRGEGGHHALSVLGPDGEPVEVDERAFAPVGPITAFVDRHYRHYNAGVVGRASRAYIAHIESGRRMLVTLAGAMSTAELGISLAEMIRQGKVHAVSCTGANLEEDIFLMVGRETYRHARWREMNAAEEQDLYDAGMNRVTDVCIPEAVVHDLADALTAIWGEAKAAGRAPQLPRTYMAEAIARIVAAKPHLKARMRDSWLCAAIQADIPVWVPGWADSTMGNIYTAWCIREGIRPHQHLLTDADAMAELVEWYQRPENQRCGFFQIGGGIAGDFTICAVPLIIQDLQQQTDFWGYFCQISDAVTSYGGYSGAPPNEKITWGKLTAETPRFMIQSDATIVAPLMFGYVLGW